VGDLLRVVFRCVMGLGDTCGGIGDALLHNCHGGAPWVRRTRPFVE